jgi:hypothetical protein
MDGDAVPGTQAWDCDPRAQRTLDSLGWEENETGKDRMSLLHERMG